MTSEEMENFRGSLEQKLGADSMGLIADDLGSLIARNTETLKTLDDNAKEIKKLKEEKEGLVLANGKLLQQVPMDFERVETREEAPKNDFSFRAQFDEKGNFIK